MNTDFTVETKNWNSDNLKYSFFYVVKNIEKITIPNINNKQRVTTKLPMGYDNVEIYVRVIYDDGNYKEKHLTVSLDDSSNKNKPFEILTELKLEDESSSKEINTFAHSVKKLLSDKISLSGEQIKRPS